MSLLAALVGLAASLQLTPAHAATLQAINADSIKLTNGSREGQNLEVNDDAKIEAEWSIPDQRGREGDTFSLGLPEVLQGRVGNFNLTPDGADSPVYGTCEVQQKQVLCTLSAEVAGKSNVGGKLWVAAQVKGEHNSSTLTFNVNGTTPKDVPLPNNAPNIGYNPYTPDEVRKFGYFTGEKELTWRVVVPGTVLAGQNKLSIHDPYANPGANFTVKTASFYKTPKTPKCWNDAFAEGCMTELWSKGGQATPGTTVNYDDDIDKIVADVDGPFEENSIYTLHLVLTVDGDVPPGSEYVNNATVNGAVVSETATKEASGGGTGQGDAVGHIQLVKKLHGPNTVPADTVFPVQFSFQRAGQEVTGTLELKADGTPVVLRNVVNGTVVTFTEQLPAVAGHIFGDPEFSGGGVTDGGAGSASATVTAQGTKKLELTLTNPVENPPAVERIVPVSPTLTPGTCTPGSTTPSEATATPATTPGITYSELKLTPRPGTRIVDVTLKATAEAGKAIDAAQLPQGWVMNPDGTATFSAQVEQPKCDNPVAPVSPEATPGVCVAGSTTPTDPTVKVPETENVTYSGLKIEGATVTLTATPAVGYAFSADTLPLGWTLNPDGTATFSAQVEQPKCDKPVAPVSPTLTPGVCEPGATEATRPTVTAADTEGITYISPAVNQVGDTTVYEIIMTARPAVGYVIDKDNLPEGWAMNADGVSANFTGTVTNPVCAKPVVPVSPTVTPGVCVAGSATATDPTVVVPETEGITYGAPEITVEGATATIKVTATRKDGFIIDGGNLPQGWVYNNDGTATFTTTVEQPKCEAPAPPTPSTPAPPTPSTPADPVNSVDPKVTPGVCKPGSSVPTPPVVELPTVPGLVYGTPSMSVHGGKVKITVVVTPEAGKKIGDLGKGWTLNQDGTATFTYMVSNPICVKPGMPKTGI